MIPSSMGAHKLDVRYGDRNSLPYYNGVLDLPVIDNAASAVIARAGKVMSMVAAGRLTVGLSDEGQIPFYSWSGLDANNFPDVQRDRGMPGYLNQPAGGIGSPNTLGVGARNVGWPGIPLAAAGASIAGGWATIRHIAAAELSSTEMVVDEAALGANLEVAYAPGVLLTACVFANAGAPTDDLGSIGLLCPAQNPADVVVGVVAPAGIFQGAEGYLTLAFTPTWQTGANGVVYNATANTLTSGVLAGPLA